MKCSLMAVAAAFLVGSGAHASSITVQAYSYSAFTGLLNSNAVVEDFESPGDLTLTFEGGGTGRGTAPNNYGEIAPDTFIGSSVGNFTGLGGQGSGNTCQNLSIGNTVCNNIALQYDPPILNGQGNIVPDDGKWSINAADTYGIVWDAFLPGGGMFSSLVFAIRDAADQRGTKFTVEANGDSIDFTGLGNNQELLFLVSFAGGTSSATVTMESSKLNDSFTIDGAAINVVPLPAPALLLLGGLGLMAGLRRRRKAA